MEPGPLPPHERTWRHPSEVAAEQRLAAQADDTPSGTLRTAALVGGTLGVLAVGLVALSFSPSSVGEPIQIGASSVQIASPSSTTTVTMSAFDAGAATPPRAAATPVVSTTSTTAGTVAGQVRERDREGHQVDPIGASGLALMPAAERTDGFTGEIDVTLSDGQTLTVEPVALADDVALVALDPDIDRTVATALPDHDEVVYVMSDDDTDRLTYAEIVGETPADAAVVTNGTGAIIGVCADVDGHLTFVPLVDEPVSETRSSDGATE